MYLRYLFANNAYLISSPLAAQEVEPPESHYQVEPGNERFRLEFLELQIKLSWILNSDS